VLLDPGYGETSRTVELLGSLRAREQLRLRRGSPPPRFSLRVDGAAIQEVEAALLTLDDTPLALDSQGRPVPPFLDGLEDGVPRYLDAQALAEVATAALPSDRRPLARSILDLFAQVPQTPPLSLLRVAAAWGAWTGDVRPLERLRPALERAASGGHGARVPADLSALRETVPLLPSTAPGSGRAATAARALHDWILDRLGANPDAALGRMQVGPVVADEWHTLDARGLRVGDALLSLSCWRRKNHFDFLLEQSEGRVPVNLVFEPIFVGWRVDQVRIGSARAEVEIGREPEGTRVRCQFPLDPERSVTISVRPLGTDHRRAPAGP
jgi:hypothetical protein